MEGWAGFEGDVEPEEAVVAEIDWVSLGGGMMEHFKAGLPRWWEHGYRTAMRRFIAKDVLGAPLPREAWRACNIADAGVRTVWDQDLWIHLPNGGVQHVHAPPLVRLQTHSVSHQCMDATFCPLYALNNLVQAPIVSPASYAAVMRQVRPAEWSTLPGLLPQVDDDVTAYVARNAGIFLVPVRVITKGPTTPKQDLADERDVELLRLPHVALFLQALGGMIILNSSNMTSGGHYQAARWDPSTRTWLCLDSLSPWFPRRYDDPFTLVSTTMNLGKGILFLPMCPILDQEGGTLGAPGVNPLSDACARILRACCYAHAVTTGASEGYLDSGHLDLTTLWRLIVPRDHAQALPPEALSNEGHKMRFGRLSTLMGACKQTLSYAQRWNGTLINKLIALEVQCMDEDDDDDDDPMACALYGSESLRLACVVDLKQPDAVAREFTRQLEAVYNVWTNARAYVVYSIVLENDPGDIRCSIAVYLLTLWTDPVHRGNFSFEEKQAALRTLLNLFPQGITDAASLAHECCGLAVVKRLFPSATPASLTLIFQDDTLTMLATRVHAPLAMLAGIGEHTDLFQVVKEAFTGADPHLAVLFDPSDPSNDVPLYNCITSRNLSQFLNQGIRDLERPPLPPDLLIPSNPPSFASFH